jgi:predicted Zn-ribbon and HTH transcriptional regulator
MVIQSELDRHAILTAIEAASKELEGLQQRTSQLHTFIAAGMSLLGVDESPDMVPSATMMEQGSVNPLEAKTGHEAIEAFTIGDRVRQYLEEVRKPLRVTEITKALVERQWVTSRNATEAIRTAMGRRKDFERIAFGVYALKEWPLSMKRWTQRTIHPLAPRRQRTVQQGLLPQLIHATLSEQGKPLTFKDIIAVVEAKGQRVNRASAIRAIYRCIKQNRLFYLVSPGVFGLREWRNDQEATQTAPARMDETQPLEGHVMNESQQGELSEAENTVDYQPV